MDVTVRECYMAAVALAPFIGRNTVPHTGVANAGPKHARCKRARDCFSSGRHRSECYEAVAAMAPFIVRAYMRLAYVVQALQTPFRSMRVANAHEYRAESRNGKHPLRSNPLHRAFPSANPGMVRGKHFVAESGRSVGAQHL